MASPVLLPGVARQQDRSWFDPVLRCWLHTGADAHLAAATMQPELMVAMDTETVGFDSFAIKCVTFAYQDLADGKVHALLLDPLRNPLDMLHVRAVVDKADQIVFHNSAYDVPGLWHHKILGPSSVAKVIDTLILARVAYPSITSAKTLRAMVGRHLGWGEFEGGMELAFKAAGYAKQEDGWKSMDIDVPVYRLGAMADTVATLRLEPVLRLVAQDWTMDHPFAHYGAQDRPAAQKIIADQEAVNRTMLRGSARGIAVDLDALASYRDSVHGERSRAETLLHQHDLVGGKGKAAAIIKYIEAQGQLPADWPRTPKGALKSDKENLDGFDHPLAVAQRTLSSTDQVLGYLEKVTAQAQVTGRCHPQVGILGASQTGRMSTTSPPLQQFSEAARPILVDDGEGLTSLDWSQIEPVTMALMAGDTEFLTPFENGADLYLPIQLSAGLPLTKEGRGVAKVALLQTMYGSGIRNLARTLGHTEESAAQLRRQMFAAMPKSEKWISQVQNTATQHGKIITAGGRILDVHPEYSFKATNYVCQGSAYDILADTILRCEQAGVGDEIVIAMHDELVVKTPAAEIVQQEMMTPPDFMERWAGRKPIFRTDRADMGRTWLKV